MTLKNVLGIRKENFHFHHIACMGGRKVQMKVKTAALAHPSWDYTFINSSEGFSSISFQTTHLF